MRCWTVGENHINLKEIKLSIGRILSFQWLDCFKGFRRVLSNIQMGWFVQLKLGLVHSENPKLPQSGRSPKPYCIYMNHYKSFVYMCECVFWLNLYWMKFIVLMRKLIKIYGTLLPTKISSAEVMHLFYIWFAQLVSIFVYRMVKIINSIGLLGVLINFKVLVLMNNVC